MINMLIKTTNKDFAEKINTLATQLHDAPIDGYEIKNDTFKMTALVSGKKTIIEIGPCNSITQREADSKGKDWFLTFSFIKAASRLEVDGVMNKYTLHLLPSSELKMYAS